MFQSCWIMNRCFDGFYLVIQIVSEATWHWHSLNFLRDQSTNIWHVSLQMESMKLEKRPLWSSWQTETIRHNPRRIPREVLAKILFWNFRQVQHCCGDRGCLESQGLHYLKRWSHYLKLSWAVTPMSTNQEVCRHRSDGTGLLSMSQMSMIQKLLSRFWSWVMTWPLLLFDYLCSLDFILLDFLILKFHKAFKSHLRAVTMLFVIDGSSQSSHHQADESL